MVQAAHRIELAPHNTGLAEEANSPWGKKTAESIDGSRSLFQRDSAFFTVSITSLCENGFSMNPWISPCARAVCMAGSSL